MAIENKTANDLFVVHRQNNLEDTIDQLGHNANTIDTALLRYGTTYDIMYEALSVTSKFADIYYNMCDQGKAGSVTGHDPAILYDSILSRYIGANTNWISQTIFIGYGITIYDFLINIDASTPANIGAEYSVDGTNWLAANIGTDTSVPAGTTELHVRFTWTGDSDLRSFGVFFDSASKLGYRGWSPVLAVADRGNDKVFQVIDWVGGEDIKPVTGSYISASGLDADINNAVSIFNPANIVITDINTNTAAAIGANYRFTGVCILTLPAAPNDGDTISVVKGNTVTSSIARNGNLIAGLAEDMVIDVSDEAFSLTYDLSATNWVISR